MSRDEVTSITDSSLLRVNVGVSAYFLQVQVQLALERVHRVCKCNTLWQIISRGSHSVEKEVCSRLVFSSTLTGELEGVSTAYYLLVRY